MRGIKAKEMAALIDFMYNGEVSIDQMDLNRFLELGEELQLKGLLRSREIMEAESVPNDVVKNEKEKTTKATKYVNLGAEQFPISGIQMDKHEKQELIDLVEESQGIEANISFPLKADVNQDLDEKNNSIIQRADDGIWSCTVCGKSDKLSHNIKKHAEIHIEGVGHPCGHCGKMLKSRNSLQVHISKTHSVKYF